MVYAFLHFTSLYKPDVIQIFSDLSSVVFQTRIIMNIQIQFFLTADILMQKTDI